MAEVRIICSSFTQETNVKILCNNVTPSYKKTSISNPRANGDELVEVQTQGRENPVYSVTGVHYTDEEGTFNQQHLIDLYKLKYDGTDDTKAYLRITYATFDMTGDRVIVSAQGTSITDIPVILRDGNYPINVSNSIDGHVPIGSLSFIETV